jgi:MYXO-CTERM domain-containing protein
MERISRRLVLPGVLAAALLVTALLPAGAAAAPRVVGDIPELGDMVVGDGLEMRDDGTEGDGVAGDGVYTARVTFADSTSPLTFSYLIVPTGGTLDDAIGLVPGFSGDPIPVVVALPASATPLTVEFRFATTAGDDGFGPVPSIADSWNTGWSMSPALRRDVPFVVTGSFQDLFGTAAFDASSEVTVMRDDGAFGDLARRDGIASFAGVSPVGIGTDVPASWRVAVQTDEASVLGLNLSADGWADDTSGQGGDFTAEAERWMPIRFEMDLLRGMARVTEAPELLDLPMISHYSPITAEGNFVDVMNTADAVLALEGIYLADDKAYFDLADPPAQISRAADVNVTFPEGAWLAPSQSVTVTISQTAEQFETRHGAPPDYVVDPDPTEPYHMRLAYPGSVRLTSRTLTDGGEYVVLYTFAPGVSLVEDLDVVVWGTPSEANELPLKTGLTVLGDTYGEDLGTVKTARSTVSSANPGLWRYDFRRAGHQRLFSCDAPCDLGDGSGYNGAFHAGAGGRYDATSQDLTEVYSQGGAVPGAIAVLSLAGIVEDEGGAPIEGALVTLRRADETLEATTGADGTFSLEVTHGTWQLTAAALGYRAASRPVRVDHHKTLDAALTLEASTDIWSLTGVITAEDGGAPIEGATVTATPGGETDTTGADGTYALDLLEGAYTLTVVAVGYRSASEMVVLDEDRVVDFVLDEGPQPVAVSGRVESAEDDAPIAGATVTLDDGAGIVLTETSAADGTFTFDTVPAETTYGLSVLADGFLAHLSDLVVDEDDLTDVLVRLTPAPGVWVVSGRVVADDDDTTPITGASVAIIEYAMATTTDASGAFSLEGLDDGVHILTVGAQGYATVNFEVTVDGSDVEDVEIVLSPATGDLVLSGTVTRSDTGAPIAGAAVEIELPDGSVRSVATGSGGGYLLAGLAGGTYDVVATALGFSPQTETVTISADTVLDFSLAPAGDRRVVLSGTVALDDAPEAEWAGTTVTLEGSAERSVATGANGAYTIGDLPTGAYTVRVSRSGYTTVEQPLTLDGDTVLDFTLLPREDEEPTDPSCGCASGGGGPGLLPLLLVGLIGLLPRRRRR